MSERERDTAFLREVSRYDGTAESQNLHDEITRLEGQVRVLRRAMFWMAVLTVLAFAGLGYAAVLSVDYPDNMMRFSRHIGVKISCALGLAALASMLCYTGLGVAYRKELDGLREKARRLAKTLLASRLGAGTNKREAPKAKT